MNQTVTEASKIEQAFQQLGSNLELIEKCIERLTEKVRPVQQRRLNESGQSVPQPPSYDPGDSQVLASIKEASALLDKQCDALRELASSLDL